MSPFRITMGLLAWALAGVLVACVGGVWPTYRLAGWSAVTAMGVGGAISLVGCVLGSAVIGVVLVRRPELAGHSVMAGASVRFAAVVVLAGVVAWTRCVPAAPMLVWVAVSYVVMLATETVGLVRVIHRSQIRRMA
ncbi:MAG TPA: hypothetical protein VMZ31_04610 [Phycisphaerae bacterium]|nr:hypothetical protein [Phycisphaerae bacterium]